MRKIENLVFEGGGVLGMAHAGAIQALEDKEILNGVQRVAGTSVGALVALLVSLKYKAYDIHQIINSTNFKKFEDHFDPFRLVNKYGVYKGDFLLNFIEEIVEKATGNKATTYGDLRDSGYLELKVYACDLNEISVKEFSHEATPMTNVAHSIRASMSIPMFFSAWRFPNEIPDDHIYVDGGTIYNYPIDSYDSYENTLGFFFKEKQETSDNGLKFYHPVGYVKSLFKAILSSQKLDFFKDDEQVAVTVFLDTLGLSSTDFHLTDENKAALFEEGKRATHDYIKGMEKEPPTVYTVDGDKVVD